jgi:carboxymethylenebutenolidase
MPHEEVRIITDDGECPAYVCTPGRSGGDDGPLPAILLYMDAGGIRPAALAMADRLAQVGYLVLLPDLFYRFGPYGPLVPAEVLSGDAAAILGPLIATTGNARAAKDTGHFLRYLKGRPDVAGGAIGAVGFCMGGGMAIAAAGTHARTIRAAASFHGGALATDAPDSPHAYAPKLTAELYIAAATADPLYPPDMAECFQAALAEEGIRFAHEVYPAAHGWMKPDFPTYDEEASERGWAAMTAFFERTLKA